jgi:hypothetical protein
VLPAPLYLLLGARSAKSQAIITNHLTSATYGRSLFGICLACCSCEADATQEVSAKFKKEGITMIAETINRPYENHNATVGTRSLLSLFAILVFTLAFSPTKAHAQILGEIEVNIPFQFHAGDVKLPPGKYLIHTLDNSNLLLMEISSEDGSTSAIFSVHEEEANSTTAKSELIFNKYGNRYFLARLFDEGNPSGSAVDESRYEKRVSEAAVEAQAHVPALHHGQRGN